MQLYDLRGYRDRCNIDISQIEGKPTTTLDQFLFFFPLQKKLSYAYLKEVDSVNLSELHQLFKDFDDIEYFSSSRHFELMDSNSAYATVVNKYIRNPWTWVTSVQQVQSYLFDAKYLILGDYQSIANRCSINYFNSQFLHYSVPYTNLKSHDQLQKHNQWFLDRKEIESAFFTNMLKKFKISRTLRVKWYWKYIEFYDEVSTMTLQFELSKYDVKMRLIWPRGNKKRSRTTSQYPIMKMLQRYQELFMLYHFLCNEQQTIAQYFDQLESTNIKHHETFNTLKSITMTFLNDYHINDQGSYIDSEKIHVYCAHHQSVERIGLVTRKGKLRMYRVVKFLNDKMNRSDELYFSSYRLQEQTVEAQAIELLSMGMINIGSTDQVHTLYDYELLATGKSKEFALQFFKLPSIDAAKLFSDYIEQLELLDAEVNYLMTNELEPDDTRAEYAAFNEVKNKELDFMSTTFELLSYQKDKDKYQDERHNRLQIKRKNIKEFINTYGSNEKLKS